MGKIEYSSIIKPYPGERNCGDTIWIKQFNNQILLCLIDVEGHGLLAQEHADRCVAILDTVFQYPMTQIIQTLDNFSRGKRGLVIGISLIDIKSGAIEYMGIGNIRTRIMGQQNHRFISRSGMLGISKARPVLEQYLLNNNDLLLMYSDGIIDHFEKKSYPEISSDPIEIIPNKIFSLFAKNNDDASCLVLRYSYDKFN